MQSFRDTQDDGYASRLKRQEARWWKRLLDVQAPYRWNLQRQGLGRTLDVGCGLGRNLASLDPGSVGIDHNAASIAEARRRGFQALTVDEWQSSPLRVKGAFDSLLLSHVVEHMDRASARRLLDAYLPYVKAGGTVFFVCPQERGYASDPTHVWFSDGEALEVLAREAGLQPGSWFSFPLPRWAGRLFTYNEFCLSAVRPRLPGDEQDGQVAAAGPDGS